LDTTAQRTTQAPPAERRRVSLIARNPTIENHDAYGSAESIDMPTVFWSMVNRTVKTTIEIADGLFKRAKEVARKEKTTFRSLIEQGLRLVLKEKRSGPRKLPPLVTVGGSGLTDKFKDAGWANIHDEIYRGHGT
jgi:hypothetical protein